MRIGALSDQHWSNRSRWRYGSAPIHRLDQDRKLRGRQRHCAINDWRPYETPFLKTLGDQPHPAAIPIQTFEIVAALAAKDEQVTAEWISADHLLCLRSQTVESVA